MASQAHMNHEVIPDALPYVDHGYDEASVQSMVNELIDEETKRYRPTKNYLEFMPSANYTQFETKTMKAEFERISNRQPMELLSMKRYELPQPPASQKNDLVAWTECLKNSMAQLQHQSERVANLDLLSQYGADSWRSHCHILQEMFEAQQKKHAEIKRKIQEVNWQRKSDQVKAGVELQHLEESWIGLVSKNYAIERAIVETEKEVETLRQEVA